MRGHDPISDSGLLLGSLFVAVALAGIGILGNPQASAQMAAAAQPASSKQACLPQGETNKATIDTTCYPGCHYVVTAGSVFGRASLTATTQYSDGSNKLGDVTFAMGTTQKTVSCKAGANGAPATLGDANGSVGYDTLRGVIGSPASDPNNYMNVVQPSGAAASGSAAPSSASAGSSQGTSASNPGNGFPSGGEHSANPTVNTSQTLTPPASAGIADNPIPNDATVNPTQEEIDADPCLNGNDDQADYANGTNPNFDNWAWNLQGSPCSSAGSPGSAALNPAMNTGDVGDLTTPNSPSNNNLFYGLNSQMNEPSVGDTGVGQIVSTNNNNNALPPVAGADFLAPVSTPAPEWTYSPAYPSIGSAPTAVQLPAPQAVSLPPAAEAGALPPPSGSLVPDVAPVSAGAAAGGAAASGASGPILDAKLGADGAWTVGDAEAGTAASTATGLGSLLKFPFFILNSQLCSIPGMCQGQNGPGA